MSTPIELATTDQSAGCDRLSSTTGTQLELRLSDCLRLCHACGSLRKPLHNPARMCWRMRANCGSIPAHAAIGSGPEPLHLEPLTLPIHEACTDDCGSRFQQHFGYPAAFQGQRSALQLSTPRLAILQVIARSLKKARQRLLS